MRTIYRYQILRIDCLELDNSSSITRYLHVKQGCKLLYAGIKDEFLCIWIELNPATIDQQFEIEFVATGQVIRNGGEFFQSVSFMLKDKQLFIHIYVPKGVL